MKTGTLIEFAAEQQWRFDACTSQLERKARGHFGTSPAIAQFMAGLFVGRPLGTIRILDPGAGVGSLSVAVCQRVLNEESPRSLHFELWENDPKLLPILECTMIQCQQALHSAGHEMQFQIEHDDFILANTQPSLFGDRPSASFHWAILNPPYFKIRKDSPQAQSMSHVVHGQPNIYALFMAVATDLLLPQGEMVAITPRSYFNGPYFKRLRKWLFDRMTARRIHLFESRTETFKEDAVLQENVILHAQKGVPANDVVVTSSAGRDLAAIHHRVVPYEKTIDSQGGDHVVRVTTSRFEQDVVEAMDALPRRILELGFAISTGPVVTFRATEFLRSERSPDTAPLLWMHNVRPFITQFPPKNGKPTHIEVSKSSKRLLIPARRCILLKRFTAKEEKRRLVAGIMTRADSYSEWVGLENHLNYVYRVSAELSEEEAFGLAAFFNSALVDLYFRAVSGNTQVNAAEIRAMPFPDLTILCQIGSQVRSLKTRNLREVESIVGGALRLSEQLIDRLIEVAE